MSAPRWPVFLWQHDAGLWAARLLTDDCTIAASAADQRAAVTAVVDEAVRLAKAGEWDPADPPADEPHVVELAVTLRGEHHAHGRVWTVRDQIRLLLPAVVMATASGRLAHLPTLGLSLRLVAGDDLKDQATHVIRRFFAGDDPGTIARHLPPRRHAIVLVAVEVPKRRDSAATRDLGALAVVAEPFAPGEGRAWQREALVGELAARLGHGSLAVVGEPGCGKSAVLTAAVLTAERRYRASVRADGGDTATARFWLTSAQRLVAGMRWLGEWQERVEEVVRHLALIDGTLCVESLSDLLAVGGEDESASIAAFLAPYLRRGGLRLVGECTASELEAIRRRLPAFADALTVLAVPPLTDGAALAVVRQGVDAAARRAGLAVAPGVATVIADCFRRHLGDAGFPGPALRFVEHLVEERSRAGSTALSPTDVLAAFSRHAGLPERLLRDELALPSATVNAEMAARVIGQDEAVAAAADVVLVVKAGLCDPRRPLATLLFAGPTGVGKTALARALADTLFAGLTPGHGLIRLDMSEYAGADAAERMLGTPHQPSDLVRRLRAQPSAVLLFDEIEKAHPVVADLLLAAIDEGRLGDTLGRRTSLRAAAVVFTTNLGSDARPVGGFIDRDGGAAVTAVRAAISAHFRPEFTARLDRVVVFRALSASDIRRIATIELSALADRSGLRARDLLLEWDAGLLDALTTRGFDPVYGARNLQRVVNELVAAPLARFLVARSSLRTALVALRWQDSGVAISATPL